MPAEHYENFPVASLLCPPRLRPAVTAIYRFARTADDIADEGQLPAAQRLLLLTLYRRDLAAALAGGTPSAQWRGVFDALAETCARHALPGSHLHALLDAFEQDVHNPAYPDRASLLEYCRRSANPVGRLLLHLYEVSDAASLQRSDQICSALQLINFWQDLSVDLPRGRVYVPETDMWHRQLTSEALLATTDSSHARELVCDLCAWAGELMAHGAALCHRLPGRAGWELRLVVQGGLRILEKIAAMDHASLQSRPTLTRSDGPRLLWRAWRMV